MRPTLESRSFDCETQVNMSHKKSESFHSHSNNGKPRISPAQTPWIHSATEVRRSKIAGGGIFTTQDIPENAVVLICGGQLFHNSEVHSGKARPKSLTGFAEGVYLGTPYDAPEGIDEYLNHSCDPNLWLKDEITLIARRQIRMGEELTVDYATWEIDEIWRLPNRCNCGSSICRQLITGKDWKLRSLQRRYGVHFLPCLNERIKRRGMINYQHSIFRLIFDSLMLQISKIRFRMLRKVLEVKCAIEITGEGVHLRAEQATNPELTGAKSGAVLGFSEVPPASGNNRYNRDSSLASHALTDNY